MSMFKSVQPAGQPRTLRSIIASKNSSGSFPADMARQELPQAEDVEGPRPMARRDGAAAKSPFKAVRNG